MMGGMDPVDEKEIMGREWAVCYAALRELFEAAAFVDTRKRPGTLIKEWPQFDVAMKRAAAVLASQAVMGRPVDDEPLTPEEAAALERAKQEIKAGRTRPWSEVRQKLG